MKKNPYKAPRQGYLRSPFSHLGIDNDVPISDEDHIQKLLNEAYSLDDKIAGDFDLFELLGQMQDYRLGFCYVGLYAFQIKKFKLYKEVSSSFHEFCKQYFHKGADYVNRLIESAEMCLELITHGFSILPSCESQFRELKRSAKRAGVDIVEAWRYVSEKYAHQPWKITYKTINTAICGEVPEEPKTLDRVVLPILLIDTIAKLAYQAGMGFTEYLQELVGAVQNTDNLSDKKKLERWEEEEEANQDYYQERLDSA